MGYEETIKAMVADKSRKVPIDRLYIIFALLGTNLMTYYFCSGGGVHGNYNEPNTEVHEHSRVSLSTPANELAYQLNLTQLELFRAQQTMLTIEKELNESVQRCDSLAKDIEQAIELIRGATEAMKESGNGDNDPGNPWSEWARLGSRSDFIRELQEFIAVRELPLGWSSGLASNSLISPIGHSCALNRDDLQRYMEYEVGGECPDDKDLGQRLLLHGCEPLPRRRCFERSPRNFTDPYPIPKCLWTIPPNNNIHWTAYTCKSFECLNDRKKHHIFADCLDCFELDGREKTRWVREGGPTDFTIDEVLVLKEDGSIRVGLDIGGGTGTFAVRMRERQVTIVTTTMNFDGPFNNMIALRGVVPLYVSISQRLPFFDNTLDIVHSMHVLSNWIPTETLEFLLFDIDRILRPGGIFWLDHFFCIRPELTNTYVPLIEKLGYKKLKWAVGDKLDRGAELQEVYLSAVLEKPYSRLATAAEELASAQI